jgi:hypothetical protein
MAVGHHHKVAETKVARFGDLEGLLFKKLGKFLLLLLGDLI